MHTPKSIASPSSAVPLSAILAESLLRQSSETAESAVMPVLMEQQLNSPLIGPCPSPYLYNMAFSNPQPRQQLSPSQILARLLPRTAAALGNGKEINLEILKLLLQKLAERRRRQSSVLTTEGSPIASRNLAG